MKMLSLAASVLIAMGAVSSARAADADAGKRVFNKCAVCHSPVAGKNGVGPSLFGVVGRKSGTEPGYNYSDAMKGANKTWDEATLNAYLTDPKSVVPGNKMSFAGLPNADDRASVVAFLATLK
jgi:cytochrome c2